MQSGSLTNDEVATLKTVYPRIYDRIYTNIMGELANRKTPLSYAHKLQIAKFIGSPTDDSLSPAGMAMLQGQAAAPAPVKNSNKVAQMKIGASHQTPFQKVEGEA
jgi:hypothetical protein